MSFNFLSNMLVLLVSLCYFVELSLVSGICPFLFDGTPPSNNDYTIPDSISYNNELSSLNISSVFDDLYSLMLDSQSCWPADIFNDESSYAGLFIRLAWHCSGTFRNTDGSGGCAGGRQRFLPESAWDDNTNLDKARALLGPIKQKYGNALSWGDLFVFAGTSAILQGGGPINDVCAGRIDNTNGSLSDVLNDNSTCNVQGNCSVPLGSSTVGLIYVNPEGFLGNPFDLERTAEHVREVFSRMGLNDSETVALIGGGHAFGKSHGACTNGSGSGPDEEPFNPWPGLCGTNLPYDTYTSGIEGQWTEYPFDWDNEYFTQLIDDNYTLIIGNGGKYQFKNSKNGYLMLVSDYSFIMDPIYYEIVSEYADDIDSLNIAFAAAWQKLTTSGGKWASNKFCVSSEELQPGRNNTSNNDNDNDNEFDLEDIINIFGIEFTVFELILFGIIFLLLCVILLMCIIFKCRKNK